MLDCTTNKSSNMFWLDFDQKPCNHLPQSITFRLLCPTAEQAEELAQQMRCKPEDFSSLRLYFHLKSMITSWNRETIEVRIDLNQQSEIVKHLLHQFQDASEALMLNDDAKELFNELASIYQKIYNEKEEESGILELIEKMLVLSREIIEKENQEKWNTVFWRDENKRPDRVCRQINKIRRKLSSEERHKFDSEFDFNETEAVSTENLTEKRPRDKSVDKTEPSNNEDERTRENLGNKKSNKARKAEASAKRNANQQQSKKSANNKEGNSQENRELRKLLAENRDNIEWDGKKYSPKLGGFLKLNLNKLRSGQSFFTELRNVASHIESSMCMPINIPLLNYKGQSVYEKVNVQKDAIKANNIEINKLRRELNARNVRITELNEAVLSRTTSIVIDSADFRMKLRNMSDEQFRACTSILKIEEGRRHSASTTSNVRGRPSSDDDSQMEAQSNRSTNQLINRPTNRRFRDLLCACLPCIKSN